MKAGKIRSVCAGIGVGVLLLGLAMAEVQAQPPGGGRGPGGRGPGTMGGRMGGRGMMGGMNVPMLLMNDQVRKEIGVTEEQEAKLGELREEMGGGRGGRFGEGMRERMQELRDLPEDQRREKFQAIMEEARKEGEKRTQETMEKLGKILKPEQLMRVKQIQMQLEGIRVLQRPEVAKQLGLDDAQKKELEKVQEDARTQMRERMEAARERMGGGEGGERTRPSREDMEKMRKEMEDSRKEIEKKMMGVLTSEQKQKLGEMMGKPFELDRSAFRRPGGDGQQRGERGDRARGDRGGRGRGEGGEQRGRGERRGRGGRPERE